MISTMPPADALAGPLTRLSREPLSRLLANQDVAAVVRRVMQQEATSTGERSSRVDVAAFGSAI